MTNRQAEPRNQADRCRSECHICFEKIFCPRGQNSKNAEKQRGRESGTEKHSVSSNRFCAAIVMKNNAAASHSKIFRGSLKQKYSAGETANSAGKNHNGAFAIGNIHSGSSKKSESFPQAVGKIRWRKIKEGQKNIAGQNNPYPIGNNQPPELFPNKREKGVAV